MLIPLLLIGLYTQPGFAQSPMSIKSEGMTLRVEQVAADLDIPWGMAFLDPDQLMVTSKNGRISILNPNTKALLTISQVEGVWDRGQGGLLDVAVSESYKAGDWIYFTYSKNMEGDGATTLARAKLHGSQIADWQDLLVTRSTTGTSRHFGSRITFDTEDHIFFAVGDRGDRPNGQDLSTHAGSTLRVKLDGSAPDDNPFVNKSGALPEIWSYGHRNPQGNVYDPQTGRLWSIEHGPRGGDEINLIEAGKNYGWPVISHGKEYWGPVQVGEGRHKKGMEQPVKVYIPSIAPSSLILYSGKSFPAWKGNLIAGALVLRHINRVVINNAGEAIKEERLLESLEERIRDLVESPEGWIYFSTDSGKIFRIRPG